jgi:hypothetical protein
MAVVQLVLVLLVIIAFDVLVLVLVLLVIMAPVLIQLVLALLVIMALVLVLVLLVTIAFAVIVPFPQVVMVLHMCSFGCREFGPNSFRLNSAMAEIPQPSFGGFKRFQGFSNLLMMCMSLLYLLC